MVCLRACVRARACVCVRARVRACACVCVFCSDVPADDRVDFAAESEEAKSKMNNLKQRIQQSGLEVKSG